MPPVERERDTFRNIENVEGSDKNETITGNSGANVINGNGGSDTIDGGFGEDTIDGLKVYKYAYTANVGPVNIVADITGTYFAKYEFFIEPKTGATAPAGSPTYSDRSGATARSTR